MARMGNRGRWRDGAHAGRPEPLERGEGSVLGAASGRAGLRGQVRPPARRPLPPCDDVPAMEAGQEPGGVSVRPAGGHDAVRAAESIRWRSSWVSFWQSGCLSDSISIFWLFAGPTPVPDSALWRDLLRRRDAGRQLHDARVAEMDFGAFRLH